MVAAGCAALVVGSAASAQSVEVRLNAIRTAFVKNDAQALSRQFPSKDRVFVALPRLEAGAFLGPGPLRALLDRLTRETRTVDFAFVEPERAIAAATGDMLYLKALWTYRTPEADTPRADELYLSLRRQPEDGEWRIVEIKVAR